jgi:glycerophosphoryl diester phosphodiesterase
VTRALIAALMLMVPGAALGQDHGKHKDKVIVIAHRGASGERPEHTLLSYTRAIEQGADFIEPDLVPTKDGVLVARHENNITETTDVANHSEFAARKATKTIDGEAMTGWFTEDFTLAELKTLRARERLPKLRPDNTKFDGQAEIPTLDEVIALAKKASKETGRTIGIYPETKHPTYFASIGLPVEQRLVDKLKAAGWDRADAPVFIQSFEVNNLKKLKGMTKVRLIQLMAGAGGPADGAHAELQGDDHARGAEGRRRICLRHRPRTDDDRQPAAGPATTLIADAHAAGLKLHPWTFRAENFFLLPSYRSGANPADHGRIKDEILYFIGLGVDGFFTDFPYIGVEARDAAAGSQAHAGE